MKANYNTITGEISVFVTNLGKYNEGELCGEWLKLPYNDSELEDLLDHIGINEQYEEYFLTDHECDIKAAYNAIGEYTSLARLNELAERLSELELQELELFAAASDEYSNNIEELIELTENLDEWTLFDGVDNEEALGEYYVFEMGCFDIPENIVGYFDFEAFGRDLHLGSFFGAFTEFGYVSRG